MSEKGGRWERVVGREGERDMEGEREKGERDRKNKRAQRQTIGERQ